MRIKVLQHAPHEGPGEIGRWAENRGHAVSIHHLYQGDSLPDLNDLDLLVVMGGEMNIYQYRDWPWLKVESQFISRALKAGKRLVGICLGSQFIADALGARVVQNPVYEVGWHPVTWTPEARTLMPDLPAESTVLHWHGDTYNLPPGATRLAASEGCPEQGFFIEHSCIALQFHVEVDSELTNLYVSSQEEWPTGPCVQKPDEIRAGGTKFPQQNVPLLHALLDRVVS